MLFSRDIPENKIQEYGHLTNHNKFTVRPLPSHLYRETSNCEVFLYSIVWNTQKARLVLKGCHLTKQRYAEGDVNGQGHK